MPEKRGVFGEIVIVVAGVLIAFALNEWWHNRAVRDQEQVHLRALISDFDQNQGRLQDTIKKDERVVSACLELLKLARSNPSAPAPLVLPHLDGVLTSYRFEPVMGAYMALLNSGGLTLIRDATLRGRLATFASESQNRYYEQLSNDLYASLYREFAGRLRLANMVEGDVDRQSFRNLLSDPKFLDYLAARHLTERDIASQHRVLLKRAEDILAQLKAAQR